MASSDEAKSARQPSHVEKDTVRLQLLSAGGRDDGPSAKQWFVEGITDIGAVRTNNEDAYWIDDRDRGARNSKEVELIIVADGMGGHEKGEEASRIAVEVIRSHLAGRAWDELELAQNLNDAINDANVEIRRSDAGQADSLKGMGTTIAIALLSDRQALIGWVGDSRIYRARNGHLKRLTDDHSFVEQLVRSGEITEEEARTHPLRNRITSALGPFARPPEVGIELVDLEPKDALLLCTDGMWEPLLDSELEGQIVGRKIDDALQGAVGSAIAAGGTDNITAVVASPDVKIPGPGPVDRIRASSRSVEKRIGRTRLLATAGAIVGPLVVVLILAVWWGSGAGTVGAGWEIRELRFEKETTPATESRTYSNYGFVGNFPTENGTSEKLYPGTVAFEINVDKGGDEAPLTGRVETKSGGGFSIVVEVCKGETLTDIVLYLAPLGEESDDPVAQSELSQRCR